MEEEIAFENGRISNFEGLVTLTLDRVMLHNVMHHSSTSTYRQISLKSKKRFVDGRTYYVSTDRHLRPTLLGRLRRVDLKINRKHWLIEVDTEWF